MEDPFAGEAASIADRRRPRQRRAGRGVPRARFDLRSGARRAAGIPLAGRAPSRRLAVARPGRLCPAARGRVRITGGRCEARDPDRAVSGDAAARGRRLGGIGRLRGAGDRLLAAGHRPDPPLRRHQPHRRRQSLPDAGKGDRWRAARAKNRHRRAWLLSESARAGPSPPPSRHGPSEARHRRRRAYVRAAGQHLLRRRRLEDPRRQLGRGSEGLAGNP